MLYILLIIIAIGVLLISEPGRMLLNFLFWATIAAGVLYLIFIAVIFVIDYSITSDFFAYAAFIAMAIGYSAYAIYYLSKKHKEGVLSAKSVKGWFVGMWRENKIVSVFLVASFLFIVSMLIYGSTIKDFWR